MAAEERVSGCRRSSRARNSCQSYDYCYEYDSDGSEDISRTRIKKSKRGKCSKKSEVPVLSNGVDKQINNVKSTGDSSPKLFPIFTVSNGIVNKEIFTKRKFCKIDEDFHPTSKNDKNKNINPSNGKHKKRKTKTNDKSISDSEDKDLKIKDKKEVVVDKQSEGISKLFPIFSKHNKCDTNLDNSKVLPNGKLLNGIPDAKNLALEKLCNNNLINSNKKTARQNNIFLTSSIEINEAPVQEIVEINTCQDDVNIVEPNETIKACTVKETDSIMVITSENENDSTSYGYQAAVQEIINIESSEDVNLSTKTEINSNMINKTNNMEETVVKDECANNNNVDLMLGEKDVHTKELIDNNSALFPMVPKVSCPNTIINSTVCNEEVIIENQDEGKKIITDHSAILIKDNLPSNQKRKKSKCKTSNKKSNEARGLSKVLTKSSNEFRRVTRSSTNSIKTKEIEDNIDATVDDELKIGSEVKETSSRKRKRNHNPKSLPQNQEDQLRVKAKVNTKFNQEKIKNSSKLFPLFTTSLHTVNNKKSLHKIKFNNPIKSDLKTNNKTTQKQSSRNVKVSKKKLVVLTDEADVPEVIEKNSSNDSIEVIADEGNKIIRKINSEIEKSCSKIKRVVNYPQSKFTNALLSYPLNSHLNFTDTSQMIADSKYNICPELNEVDFHPKWDKIVGLTDIKSFKEVNKEEIINNVLDTRKDLSDDYDNENNCQLWTDAAYNSLVTESSYKSYLEYANKSSIEDLREWLQDWKYKFTNPKRKLDKDEDFEYFSDSCDSDDGFSNSIIISGAPSTGKTSLVFSLANELGFKVLEVNASECRNGRNVNHHLKEALESYHVENIKIDVTEEEASQKKNKKDYFAKHSMKEKHVEEEKREKKSAEVGKIEKKGISNFFKPTQSSTKKSQDQKHPKQCEADQGKAITDSSHCKISSQTIILFDDIDVVFDEDEGLWSTIKGFLKISKKPVIFTVSRNLSIVKANLSTDIKVIHLMPMLHDLTVTNLRNHCNKNGRIPDSIDIPLLAALNANDTRRSLLFSQFWTLPSSKNCNLRKSSGLATSSKNQDYNCIKDFLQSSTSFSSDTLQDYVFQASYRKGLNLISTQHSLGYDLLYANLFSIFNLKNELDIKQEWKDVIQSQKINLTEKKPDLNLFQEARAALEFKKKVLKAGSHSNCLFEISSLLDKFSFCDSLKGYFCKNTEFLSLPERIDKWSSGLPMCDECDFSPLKHLVLELISNIQVLSLRKSKNDLCLNEDSSRRLFLEHPFFNIDTFVQRELKTLLDDIAFILPTAQFLNKRVLNIDYLSTLKIICHAELCRQTQSKKRTNRFLHYFDSISIYFDISKIETL